MDVGGARIAPEKPRKFVYVFREVAREAMFSMFGVTYTFGSHGCKEVHVGKQTL